MQKELSLTPPFYLLTSPQMFHFHPSNRRPSPPPPLLWRRHSHSCSPYHVDNQLIHHHPTSSFTFRLSPLSPTKFYLGLKLPKISNAGGGEGRRGLTEEGRAFFFIAQAIACQTQGQAILTSFCVLFVRGLIQVPFNKQRFNQKQIRAGDGSQFSCSFNLGQYGVCSPFSPYFS